MATFIVKGSFDVPIKQKKLGREIDKTQIKNFWQSNKLGDSVGCYVFAYRAAKGIKPIYVGKATTGFKSEVFAQHKLGVYNSSLLDQQKGTPIIFLIAIKKNKGPVNEFAIDEAETFLIESAKKANPNIMNDRKAKEPKWNIEGIVRSKKRGISKSAAELKTCLNL